MLGMTNFVTGVSLSDIAPGERQRAGAKRV